MKKICRLQLALARPGKSGRNCSNPCFVVPCCSVAWCWSLGPWPAQGSYTLVFRRLATMIAMNSTDGPLIWCKRLKWRGLTTKQPVCGSTKDVGLERPRDKTFATFTNTFCNRVVVEKLWNFRLLNGFHECHVKKDRNMRILPWSSMKKIILPFCRMLAFEDWNLIQMTQKPPKCKSVPNKIFTTPCIMWNLSCPTRLRLILTCTVRPVAVLPSRRLCPPTSQR